MTPGIFIKTPGVIILLNSFCQTLFKVAHAWRPPLPTYPWFRKEDIEAFLALYTLGLGLIEPPFLFRVGAQLIFRIRPAQTM